MDEKRVLLHVRDPVEVSVMMEEEKVYAEEEERVMLLRVIEPVELSVMSGGDRLT